VNRAMKSTMTKTVCEAVFFVIEFLRYSEMSEIFGLCYSILPLLWYFVQVRFGTLPSTFVALIELSLEQSNWKLLPSALKREPILLRVKSRSITSAQFKKRAKIFVGVSTIMA